VIAEELGRAVAPVPFSSSIALAAEFLMRAGSETQKQQHLRGLATGESIGCFAYAEGTGRVTSASIRTIATRSGETRA
jgi:acyl-CoA dehydrogenase